MVLPGNGLGWVKTDRIVRTERESASYPCVDDPDRRFVENQMSWSLENRAARRCFLEILPHIGSSLRSLDLYTSSDWRLFDTNDTSSMIRTALRHCVNLQHLESVKSALRTDSATALVEMFERGAGDHLLSLDLDLNWFGPSDIDLLARWLANPAKIPPLRKLRLVLTASRADYFERIAKLLSVSKTLEVVHLFGQFWDELRACETTTSHDDADVVRKHIHDQFQGEVLVAQLALTHKLVFLSVLCLVGVPEATTALDSSRYDLDSYMVASIFQFAAHQTRRRIMWEMAS